MKMLFIHDTKIKMDNLGYFYTGGSFNQEVWNRYLKLSKDLTVIARKEDKYYDHDFAKKHFDFFDKENINFIDIPNLSSSIKSFFNLKMRRIKNEIILKAVTENDYIIARLPSSSGTIAIRYAKKYKKPYLVEVVGCPWDALWNYDIRGKLIAPLIFYKTKTGVKNAPFVVYVTNEFLQNRYPTNGESVNCSNVNLTEFDVSNLNKRIEKIASFNLNNKVIIGTTAAVDVNYKGQQYVIQALGELKKQGRTNYVYQLVGSGDQSKLRLASKKFDVEEHVEFLGSMTHDKVFEWLDSIDVYVQPSVTEGLPRALIEAMSRGLIVFGSNAGGIPELLDKECIFRKKSVDDLTVMLRTIDKDKMEYYAKRNFEEAKKYDKEVINKRRDEFLLQFYNS